MSDTLGIYMYMGNSKEVIKILESEGITTKDQAINRLRGDAQGNIIGHAVCVGSGNFGSSLAGTANCVKQVVEYFEKKNQTVINKVQATNNNSKSQYRYSCSNCDYVRDGLLDNPHLSWNCPKCGNFPKVEEVF